MSTGNSSTDVITRDEPHRRAKSSARPHHGTRPKRQPRYHVILWDDDDHTYEYVCGMLKQLFGYPTEQGFQIAKKVDGDGRAVCLTTTREHAELKRDQIHSFGPDRLIDSSIGSMFASIEPESQ